MNRPRPIALVREEDEKGRSMTTFTCHTEKEIDQQVALFNELHSFSPSFYKDRKIVIGRIQWKEAE
jgi:hypothetical protein